MKIISITTIKNEADIIESFIRYHLNIVDMMIILNNGSTDDTNNILENLINEGLPIIVIEDEDKYFEPLIKYNFLLKKAIDEFGADIICPLDCDEFIISKNGNPRDIIEKIPSLAYYQIRWKTYIPTNEDDENILFVPKRITYIRDENLENLSKVILTKDLVLQCGATLTIGNHRVDFDEKYNGTVRRISNTGLNIAHFPLRSINQTSSKVLVNYPNTLSRKSLKKGMSFHYTILFNKLKDNNSLTMDDVTEFAKQYSLEHNKFRTDFDKNFKIDLFKDPINLSFCKNIDIKYSFDENPLKNVLNNYVYFAKEINKFKNEIEENSNLIQKFSDENRTLRNKYNAAIDDLNNFEATKVQFSNYLDEYKKLHKKYVEMYKEEYISQSRKLIKLEYLNKSQLKKLEQKNIEIDYIKNNNFNSKLKLFYSYLFLIFHSNFKFIFINFKLFNSLRDNEKFNVGYYIQNNPQITEDKLFKRFSPELHYVCIGFDKGFEFNRKFGKFNNKYELFKKLNEK